MFAGINTLFLLNAGGTPKNDMLTMVLMFVPLILIMYFFWIRPESKRKKEAAKMMNELIVGDEVTTIGGIVGKIVSLKDDLFVLETGPDKIRMQFVVKAISSVTPKEKA